MTWSTETTSLFPKPFLVLFNLPYCFVERYKSTLTRKYRKVSVTYVKKMSQIIKVATQELEHNINKALTEENEFVQTAVLTQISATFLDQCQKCVQPNTYKNDGLFIKKFIDDFGHDTIINNISIQSLKRYFNNDCLTNGAITTLMSSSYNI